MKKLSIRAFILFAFLFLPIFVHAEVRNVTVHGTIHEGTLEQQILDSVNEQRRLAGVPELQMDMSLTRAARQRAVEIGTYYDSRHLRTNLGAASTVMNDFGISYYAFGENIAAGYSTVSRVMNEWIQSTPHYNNIVNSRYSAIGIGVYQSSDGRWFWVQDFKDSLNTVYEANNTADVVSDYSIRYEDTILSNYVAEELNDVTLDIGDSHMINFHVTTVNDVTDSNVPLYLLDWESSNTAIAEIETINQKVYVSAKSAGDAVIQTTFGGVTYQFQVTVNGEAEPIKENPTVWVKKGYNYSYEEYEVTDNSLVIDETVKNAVTEYLSDGSIQNPTGFDIFFCYDKNCDEKIEATTYQSKDTNIVQYVDGQFIFQNSGKTTITAIFENGFRVDIPFEVFTYSFEKNEYSMFVGDQLSINLQTNYPEEYMLDTSDSNIVDVLEDQSIFAKSPGTAEIAALSNDGFIAYTKIHVYNKEEIEINANTNTVELIEGEQFRLIVQTNYDNPIVTYEVKDETIATCNDGLILGLEEGNTTLVIHASYEVHDGLVVEADKEINIHVSRKNIPVTDILLDKDSYEIFVGDSLLLQATVIPENADNQDLSWSSSDNSILSVDGNGKVSALRAGSAVITVTAENGVSKDVHISVLEKQVNSLQVDVNSIELTVGDTQTIHATSDNTITWEIENQKIATIDSLGVITAVGEGSTILTVSDGTNTVLISVRVNRKEIPITSLEVENDSIELTVGEEMSVEVSIYPNNTTDSLDLGWMSSNENIATVQNGTIKAIQRGDAVITVTSVNGVQLTINVHVIEKLIPVSSISTLDNEVLLYVGDTHSISIIVNPEDANEEVSYQYESSNPLVVTIRDNTIVSHQVGDAIVTITTNTGLTTSIHVTVQEKKIPITDIEISKNSLVLAVGDETDIQANVLPGYTTDDKTISWKSSNERIVTVTQNGHIKAIGSGQAFVTLTTSNGITETIQVEVKKKEEVKPTPSPVVVNNKPTTKPISYTYTYTYTSHSSNEEEETEEVLDTTENHEYTVVFDSNTFLLQNKNGDAYLKLDELTDIDSIHVDKNEKVIAFYDIYFDGGNSNFMDSTYHIQIPISFDEKLYKKVYVASIVNGKVQEVFLSNYQDGAISFTTDHLGEYSIIGVTKEKEIDTSLEVETSKDKEEVKENNHIIPIILLIVILIGSFFVISRLTYDVFNKNKKED